MAGMLTEDPVSSSVSKGKTRPTAATGARTTARRSADQGETRPGSEGDSLDFTNKMGQVASSQRVLSAVQELLPADAPVDKQGRSAVGRSEAANSTPAPRNNGAEPASLTAARSTGGAKDLGPDGQKSPFDQPETASADRSRLFKRKREAEATPGFDSASLTTASSGSDQAAALLSEIQEDARRTSARVQQAKKLQQEIAANAKKLVAAEEATRSKSAHNEDLKTSLRGAMAAVTAAAGLMGSKEVHAYEVTAQLEMSKDDLAVVDMRLERFMAFVKSFAESLDGTEMSSESSAV